MNKGLFITFEGGEGAGKTTVIKEVAAHLEALGIEVVLTREPGGIQISEKIRTIILDPVHTMMDGRTEALLYAAARRQHLVEKVIPALANDQVVLCDRFIDSSLAYQGHARGLGMDEVYSMNQFAIDGCMPDMTIFMDVTPAVGLARIHANASRDVDRLDMETNHFHDKVYEGYQILLDKYPNRIVKVNAERTPDKICAEVNQLIMNKLNEVNTLN
ncbi:dTMP kinase [Paenibacillus sp. N1-5-1-14]|uniref:dTMP kinase n=1 Tax=Paenibacillus radicibacter TaxID=2972488 RepID=UPI0021590D17|nr:dTMP kinase [Paenibacillus radicibacter]MCR8645890.1 dTMP kinase [Paenibacillus radicibacter]MCR8646027.1 dTMP kinase [Paenibacillus radicibacter]